MEEAFFQFLCKKNGLSVPTRHKKMGYIKFQKRFEFDRLHEVETVLVLALFLW